MIRYTKGRVIDKYKSRQTEGQKDREVDESQAE
jgi:hypothetical protein